MLDVKKKECQKRHLAVQDTLSVVNGKWKLVILAILMEGKKRFRELSREAGISPRILSKELQDLEINKLVSRTVCNTKPVTVEYAVTAYSKTLEEVIEAMNKWGIQHREEITGRKYAQVSNPEISISSNLEKEEILR